MKILVAMDEFNGIISSYQANRFVEEAVASQIEDLRYCTSAII